MEDLPEPVVEHVISDSPGLEDAASPVLAKISEEKARSVYAEGRSVADMLRDMGRQLEDDQWTVSQEEVSLEQWLDFVRRVDGAQYGAQLRKASAWGETRRAKELLARGCDPRGADGLGYTALHYAAQSGQLEMVNMIFDKSLAEARDEQGWTPVVVAAANGHLKVLDRLVALGANVNATTDQGRTALHWAAAKGRTDCIAPLIKKGCDVKAGDLAGMTPVHLAAEHGHVATCAKLLSLKNDKNNTLLKLKNHVQLTPQDYADPSVFWVKVVNQSKRK